MIEESGELRVAAASGGPRGCGSRLSGAARWAPSTSQGKPIALERPRGQEAAWLHELGLEARAVLIEPSRWRDRAAACRSRCAATAASAARPEALKAFAASVAHRLAAERSVEIERLRYGMEARERERTRWAREIHDECIQGIGALRMQLANARDLDDKEALSAAVDAVLEGLGHRDRRPAPPDHRASPRRAR